MDPVSPLVRLSAATFALCWLSLSVLATSLSYLLPPVRRYFASSIINLPIDVLLASPSPPLRHKHRVVLALTIPIPPYLSSYQQQKHPTKVPVPVSPQLLPYDPYPDSPVNTSVSHLSSTSLLSPHSSSSSVTFSSSRKSSLNAHRFPLLKLHRSTKSSLPDTPRRASFFHRRTSSSSTSKRTKKPHKITSNHYALLSDSPPPLDRHALSLSIATTMGLHQRHASR